MDAVVKTLIVAACVCVIAVSGHYGYARYQEHAAEVQRAFAIREEVIRAAKEAQKEEADRRERLANERAARRNERNERIAEEERKKQQDRDNAAAILKDAVTNY